MPIISALRGRDLLLPASVSSARNDHGALATAGTNMLDTATSSIQYQRRSNQPVTTAMMQERTLQIVVSVMACLSLASAICAIYWFCMMRRNFRRDLVLLLIVGGAIKSLSFLVFSGVTFSLGPVSTESPFCQFSGYTLLLGFEFCDVAILFMSMHMSFQVFPPKLTSKIFGSDGLYRVRRWVYGAWVFFPFLMASLAFVNPEHAYVDAGGFCFLPIRPLWYRLALFWLPRYFIWLYIVYIAVKIYMHVGREFKLFKQENDRTESVSITNLSAMEVPDEKAEGRGRQDSHHTPTNTTNVGEDITTINGASSGAGTRPKESIHTGAKTFPPNTTLGSSAPNWNVPGGPQYVSASRRSSRQLTEAGVLTEDFAMQPAYEFEPRRTSIISLQSIRSSAIASLEAAPEQLDPVTEAVEPADPLQVDNSERDRSADQHLHFRRRAIQRQLRLLFVYPAVYMVLWLVPFVNNCMDYFSYWIDHPIFPMSIIQVWCLSVMTFADVLVFCWRERPWRHIPGSDGTFWGSLAWWRFVTRSEWAMARRSSSTLTISSEDDDVDPRQSAADGEKTESSARLVSWCRSPRDSQGSRSGASRPPLTKRPSVPPQRRAFSGGSDRKQLAAEQAAHRLSLERKEYEMNKRTAKQRNSFGSPSEQGGETLHSQRKDWFDTGDEGLFTVEEGELTYQDPDDAKEQA